MEKSRKEYMQKYRKGKKMFGVLLEKKQIKKIEKILKKRKITKVDWINELINNEVEL